MAFLYFQPGVNFTNILWTAFLYENLCTAFKCFQLGFVIFWQKDFGTKAANKMLVKLPSGWIVQLVRSQQCWICLIHMKSAKLKIEQWKNGVSSLFYQVISNWLSLSYQTNHNIDLISTANQNDSTWLKTLSNYMIQLVGKKSGRETWQNVQKYHVYIH